MINFCTLFNSNYLDKAMCMAKSLEKVSNDYRLYILPIDDLCYDLLQKLELKNVILIKHSDFATDELLEIKKTRTLGQYCFTCTPFIIKYVIDNFDVDSCTYIDSDLYFFSNPQIILDEMKDSSVQIIKHNFKNNSNGRLQEKKSGKFCVEFNTFKKEKESIELLNWWASKCLNDVGVGEKVFGDQMYLTDWEKYPFVQVVKNEGAGIAPWNVDNYKLIDDSIIQNLKTKEQFKMVFYHFHYLCVMENDIANINVNNRYWKLDKKLIDRIYDEYLLELYKCRIALKEKYDFVVYLNSHPGLAKSKHKKLFKKIITLQIFPIVYRRIIARIKNSRRSKYDIYDLKKLLQENNSEVNQK